MSEFKDTDKLLKGLQWDLSKIIYYKEQINFHIIRIQELLENLERLKNENISTEG